MKRLLVATVLVAGIAAVAFASLNNNRKKSETVKKTETPKKECRHLCPYSQL